MVICVNSFSAFGYCSKVIETHKVMKVEVKVMVEVTMMVVLECLKVVLERFVLMCW